jgi:anti-sigma factor RsiW
VSDAASQLTPGELAELCALADGTLPAARRAEVEARVAASPELQELVERQRRAVLATQSLAADEPSAALRAAVTPRTRRRFAPRLAFAAAIAVAAAVVGAVLLNGGPGSPSVADAARLATEPATAPAPSLAGSDLDVSVDGVVFPDLARAYGWQPLGVRHGTIDGRDATVVHYGKGDRRIAYAIVSGRALARPAGGRTEVRYAVPFQSVRLNDRLVVTWRRDGRTCVLIGDAPREELLRLASWTFSPRR